MAGNVKAEKGVGPTSAKSADHVDNANQYPTSARRLHAIWDTSLSIRKSDTPVTLSCE